MTVRHILLRLCGVAIVAALLGATIPAGATDVQSGSPDQAVPLAGRLTGQLAAGASGHFAYYKFAYPGGVVTTVNVQVTPEAAVLNGNVGFKVYGPQGGKVYLTSGRQPGLVPNLSGDLVSADPGVYLVQVYSYDPNTSIDFTIWATGLPELLRPSSAPGLNAPQPGETATVAAPESTPAADATVTATATPTPPPQTGPVQSDNPDRPVPLTRDLRAHLEPGGTFAYYRIGYTGGTVTTINMRVNPDDPVVLGNVGFRVYGPTPGKVYLTSGAQPGLTPNVSGDLVSAEPGVYLIQVYNYDPRTPVDLVIWATGVPPGVAPSAAPVPASPAPAPPGV
jgi:hypothetical protein